MAGDANVVGARSNLEIHHKEFRSHAGDDSEENLITLCTGCHSLAHHGEGEVQQAQLSKGSIPVIASGLLNPE